MRNIDNGMVSPYYSYGALDTIETIRMPEKKKTLRLVPKGHSKNAKSIITRGGRHENKSIAS